MFRKTLLVLLILYTGLTALYAEDEKPIITVLDFDTSEVAAAEMKSIISILSSSLFQTELFTVIDVSQRETVLREMEFSMSGCTDESCMLEVGKMLSAEGIVVGSISRVGTKYVLSAKLLETESAKTLSTADGIYADLDELLENIGAISTKLSRPFGVVAPATAETPASQPSEAPQKSGGALPWITAAGAAGSLGTGAYFLVVSLPLLIEFSQALSAYKGASEANGDDITALYNAAEYARLYAENEDANTKFIIGASLAGAGAALGVLSAVLFTGDREKNTSTIDVAFVPGPAIATLFFHVRR